MESVKSDWLIIIFSGVTEAIRADKIFSSQKLPGQLIPTPRSIRSSCGLCWRTQEEKSKFSEIIEQNSIHIEGYYQIQM